MANRLDFESYCKRIRKLKSFKLLPELEFKKKAKALYDKKYGKVEQQEIIKIRNEVGIWLSKEEAQNALTKFNNYKKGKNFTDFADVELLKRLVSFDIEIERIQADINEKRQKNKDDKKVFIPTYAISAINKLTEQALTLRKALGLTEEQKTQDPLIYINQLREKAKKWREKNRLQFEAECPVCKEILMLRWRVKDKDGNPLYDVFKHPFYKDKILCNEWLWQLYKQGKITKLDIAKVLFPENWKNVDTTLYVDWLEKTFFTILQDKPSNDSATDESGSD